MVPTPIPGEVTGRLIMYISACSGQTAPFGNVGQVAPKAFKYVACGMLKDTFGTPLISGVPCGTKTI